MPRARVLRALAGAVGVPVEKLLAEIEGDQGGAPAPPTGPPPEPPRRGRKKGKGE
jgi:hypothetical protein